MTSMFARLKANALEARQSHAMKAFALTAVYAEAAMLGKEDGNREPTDAEVLSIIRQHLRCAREGISALWTPAKLETNPVRAAARQKLQTAQVALASYLPPQVTVSDVTAAIAAIVVGLPDRSEAQVDVILARLAVQFEDNFDDTYAGVAARMALGLPILPPRRH